MSGREIILKQLESARLGIEAAMQLLGAEAPAAVVADPSAPCSHPAVMRRPEPTGGAPNAFLCRACHTIVDPDQAAA